MLWIEISIISYAYCDFLHKKQFSNLHQIKYLINLNLSSKHYCTRKLVVYNIFFIIINMTFQYYSKIVTSKSVPLRHRHHEDLPAYSIPSTFLSQLFQVSSSSLFSYGMRQSLSSSGLLHLFPIGKTGPLPLPVEISTLNFIDQC